MIRLDRILRSRPYLVIGIIAGAAVYPLLGGLPQITRNIVCWDVFCLVFILLAARKFAITGTSTMPADAERQEEGEWTIFSLIVVALVASFAAVLGLFSLSKDLHGHEKAMTVLLVAATLFLSWLMTHTVFAFRYAHEYYEDMPNGELRKGLEFPGGRAPDYWDFFYFALVLGMTFQVSDVQITDYMLRRLATAHGLLGFLFNTVILALSVNIGSSLL